MWKERRAAGGQVVVWSLQESQVVAGNTGCKEWEYGGTVNHGNTREGRGSVQLAGRDGATRSGV